MYIFVEAFVFDFGIGGFICLYCRFSCCDHCLYISVCPYMVNLVLLCKMNFFQENRFVYA